MASLIIIESKLSLSNLESIANYYEMQQPGSGIRFVRYYYKQIEILTSMPNIGRMGKVFGTRELVLLEFPYFIVYRVKKYNIHILRVFHQMRCYP